MRNIEGLSNPPGVVNILPGAATAFAPRSGPVIVKLKRDADDVMARGLHDCRSNGAVDPAGHCHDHALSRRGGDGWTAHRDAVGG